MSSPKAKSSPNEPWLAHYPKGIPTTIEDEVARYRSIVDVFDEACESFPTRYAYTNMGASLTYSELNRKAESFAAFLQQVLKLKRGERIAIQMPNLLQYPIALYGAMKAGLVIVNTNPLYTEREMLHQFNDSGAAAIVILSNFAHHLEKIISQTKIRHIITTEIGDMLPFPKRLVVNAVVKYAKKMVPSFHLPDAIPFNQTLREGAAQALDRVEVQLDDIAFLQYTGGTTGVSKAAMLTHRNMVANMQQIYAWTQPLLRPNEELAICALPLYHIFAMTLHGLALVKFGCNNILITNPRDIPGFIKEFKGRQVTLMSGVNTLFNALLNNRDFASVDFSKLKVSVAGGMALQGAVAKRWKDVTGTTVIEGYGLTETSPVVCVNPVDGTDRVGSIGLPVPSTHVRLLDDDGNDVKPGESGELSVRGPQVMKGYWQQPEETKKVLPADGYLRTGDIAVIDDEGFVKIVDRKKDMILVSGFNVYPNEVEDVIAHHPGVLEVAAIGVPNEHSGETVKIFVVKKDPNVTAEELIAYARKSLTSYKVPKQVEFRTELPKTNVGKILRRALRTPTHS